MKKHTSQLTDRQTRWLNAAKTEAKKGNGVTAGLFFLFAQPNDEEKNYETKKEQR